MMNKAELLNSLSQFHGSVELFNHSPLFPRVVYTQGVKFLADNASCHWLLDLIASHQPKLINAEFQTWLIRVDDGQAIITCSDGNGKHLVTQEVEYTDFPLDHFKLFVVHYGKLSKITILLPSEY